MTLKESLCCEDIELLSVALRPFYLPRDFNQVFVTVVYIHPKANVQSASEKISELVQRLSSASPDSPSFVLGDFNKCRLTSTLPHFKQYVTCQTPGSSTIDLCYGNIPSAYRSRQLPALGNSDHSMVQLVPLYRQKLKSVKPAIRTVKTWTSETLNGCFEINDWDVFLSDSSIDSAAKVISSYINFCVDMTINTKQIRYFGNDKPWVSKQLKALLHKKRDAFKQNDKDKVKAIQRDIDKQITADKRSYKAKLEDSFKGNDPRQYWKGIETITGYKARKSQLQTGDDARLAEELNSFYTRFDKYDFSDQQKEIMEEVHCRQSQPVQISQEAVRTCFLKVKTHSAAGPDNISGKTLKECSDSLAPIFTKLFQRSLDEGTIPSLTHWHPYLQSCSKGL